MEKETVLVVGGSGFLGSHVADALSRVGFHVRILDTLQSKWINGDQEMIVGDIMDEAILEEAIHGCTAVYNFAAVADLNEAIKAPIQTVKINVLGNVMLLETCRKHNVKRFVFASSVYVHSREGSFYRSSKIAAENYVEDYQKAYGLDYTILRYGSLYGPRSDAHNGLWRLVKKALDTGRLTYEGNIESVREYIHVEDAAKASVLALHEDFKNQHIVLTGHEPMKVIELLKTLAEILGINEPIEFQDLMYLGHYVRTPYAYQPKLGRKYVPPMHVDLGQGLIQLIDDIRSDNINHKN